MPSKFLNISTDNTLGGNSPSDEIVSSQKAIKEYIANAGTGANTSLSNLTTTGQNISNWSSNVTNCITEIPQDIKVELSSGTLTLKAGSKLYIPNGVDTFDEYILTEDISNSTAGSGTTDLMFFYRKNTNELAPRPVEACYSGNTKPSISTTTAEWYDTANNIIKHTNDTGSTWTDLGVAFPVCICSRSGGSITGINQVLNGFGYIGKTVYVLPGVKGLTPNGRNADGTLNNIEFSISSVMQRTFSTQTTTYATFGIDPTNTNVFGLTSGVKYDEKNNINIENGSQWTFCLIGKGSLSSGTITYFNMHSVFHALDYNDKQYIAHQAMPNSRVASLTLGASGTLYTAPADGYFALQGRSSSTTDFRLSIYNQTTNISSGFTTASIATSRTCYVSIPVSKGDSVEVIYVNLTSSSFRFIYANGAL